MNRYIPLFACNVLMKNKFWSTFYEKFFDYPADATAKALVSVQHFIFFPVMAIARFFLYFRSWFHVIVMPDRIERSNRVFESVLMTIFASWCVELFTLLLFPFFFFPSFLNMVCLGCFVSPVVRNFF